MPDQAGYGQSLFDDQAPRAMASAIASVTSKLGELTGGFTSLGSVTDSVLSKMEQRFDSIKQKISSIFTGLGSAGGALGAQAGQGLSSPRPSSALVPLGPQWAALPAPPDSRTGSAPNLAGMPSYGQLPAQFPSMQPVAPAPVRAFTPMASYGAGGFGGGAGGGGARPGGGGPPLALPPGGAPPGQTPTTTPTGQFPTMGSLAAESFPAAIGGAVSNIFSGNAMNQAMQGAAYGSLAAALGYANYNNAMRYPIPSNGPYAQNYSDMVNAAAMGVNQLSLGPGSANWGNTFAGAKEIQNLVPGLNASQSLQAAGQFQQVNTINRAQMFGMQFRPGGNIQTAGTDMAQLYQRLFAPSGGNPGGTDVGQARAIALEAFQSGNQGQQWLTQIGIDPNSPAGQGFATYSKLAAQSMAQGKGMPDPNNPALRGAFQDWQKAQAQASKTFAQVVPDFAAASDVLNRAATMLLKIVEPFAKATNVARGAVGAALGQSGGGSWWSRAIKGAVSTMIPGSGFIISGVSEGVKALSGGGGGGGGGSTGGGTGSTSPSTAASNNVGVGASGAGLPSGAAAWNYKNTSGTGPMQLTGFFAQGTTGKSGTGGTGDGTGGTGDGTTTHLTGSGNVQQAYNFLIGKGLADYQAAGIVGNLAQESGGVNPGSVGMGGAGIAGWTPPTQLTDWAKTQKRDPNQLVTQLDYLWSELTTGGSEHGALIAVQGSADAASAATAFMNGFERPDPNKANLPARQKYAQNVLKSKGANYARGSMMIDRTQLALLHAGERVIPAAENYSASGRYQRLNSDGGTGGGPTVVHLNFKAGSIVLQVPPGATPTDMTKVANQFVAALNNPSVLAGARSV